jgi:hypothetical protein
MCDPEKSFALWRSHDQAPRKRPRDPAQLAKLMIDTASGKVEGRDLSRQPLRRRMLRHLEKFRNLRGRNSRLRKTGRDGIIRPF